MANNANTRNGTAIVDAIKGSSYLSAMGYVGIHEYCLFSFISKLPSVTSCACILKLPNGFWFGNGEFQSLVVTHAFPANGV